MVRQLSLPFSGLFHLLVALLVLTFDCCSTASTTTNNRKYLRSLNHIHEHTGIPDTATSKRRRYCAGPRRTCAHASYSKRYELRQMKATTDHTTTSAADAETTHKRKEGKKNESGKKLDVKNNSSSERRSIALLGEERKKKLERSREKQSKTSEHLQAGNTEGLWKHLHFFSF